MMCVYISYERKQKKILDFSCNGNPAPFFGVFIWLYIAVNALKNKCHMFLEDTNTDTQVNLTLTHLFRELTHAE